jgi:hypothetical protein
MLAIGRRQTVRAVIFDRVQLIQFVLAQTFRAQVDGAETEADENNQRQSRDNQRATDTMHAPVYEELRTDFCRDDCSSCFCRCGHEFDECSRT